jgi:hypothetical protein
MAAMDYLLIQASAVPCKRFFSSSGHTATKRHNCIKLDLMKALQLVKFMRKKDQLTFTGGWQSDISELEMDEFSTVELAHLLTVDSQKNSDHLTWLFCGSDEEEDAPPIVQSRGKATYVDSD